MLRFNNDHIFTGYLKQLLASFNLPKYRVYTKEQEDYFKKYGEELNVIPTIKIDGDNYPEDLRYTAYIKDDKIQHYIREQKLDGSYKHYWQPSKLHYHENKKEINYTKTLQIKNNIYDSYTHEYLGNFLRFIRDYYDVNMMPLYNCFSNKLCTNLNLKFEMSKIINNQTITKDIVFDSRNESFKIYMLPVKLYKEYTIAIDSNLPIELCCGFYGVYLDSSNKSTQLSKITYQKVSNTSFNAPFVYDKLSANQLSLSDINALDLAQNEDDLKLFIKVPINNKSSITILEGNYLRYNDMIYDSKKDIIKQNKVVTNFFEGQQKVEDKTDFDDQYVYLPLGDRHFTPITQLQLLALNTGESYPFADRLIEYLSENAITKLDRLPDNIRRAQTVLQSGKRSLTDNPYAPETLGLWDNKMQIYLYDAMVNNKLLERRSELKHDLLGYIDKDTEENITRTVYKKIKNRITGDVIKIEEKRESISRIDLYSNLYNNTYLDESEKYLDKEELDNER